jgi:hypothetical protein
VTTLPEPLIVVDPLDPLLEHFALQHDLRARFAHALEEIVAVIDAEPTESVLSRLTKAHDIATEAISDEAIEEWMKRQRPLPWLDEVINPLADQVRREVMEMLGL